MKRSRCSFDTTGLVESYCLPACQPGEVEMGVAELRVTVLASTRFKNFVPSIDLPSLTESL